jgi:hypothetical protein
VEKPVSKFTFQVRNLRRYSAVKLAILRNTRLVGRCKFNSVDPYLESDWFQPLSL